jgi:hypothetical protein
MLDNFNGAILCEDCDPFMNDNKHTDMIKRIEEIIKKYKTEDEDTFDGWDMNDMIDEFLSDLKKLKKLAERQKSNAVEALIGNEE